LSPVKNTETCWVYILELSNGHLYTGYTVDLEKRMKQHQEGSGSKLTRSFLPLKLLQSWKVKGKSLAMQVEHKIKKLNRKQKLEFIKNPLKLDVS